MIFRMAIWDFFKEYQKKKLHKRLAFALWAEVKKNLESYYVMYQIERLRSFQLQSWEEAHKHLDLTQVSAFAEYIRAIQYYQAALTEFKEYETWYSADIAHKSQETGRLLHDKKEEAEKRFQGLEGIIKDAQKGLEEEFRRRRLIR
jgi:hypothetical protein